MMCLHCVLLPAKVHERSTEAAQGHSKTMSDLNKFTEKREMSRQGNTSRHSRAVAPEPPPRSGDYSA